MCCRGTASYGARAPLNLRIYTNLATNQTLDSQLKTDEPARHAQNSGDAKGCGKDGKTDKNSLTTAYDSGLMVRVNLILTIRIFTGTA
jgi:hypothetical protein